MTMSSIAFVRYACILLFLMVVVKTDSQGYNNVFEDPDFLKNLYKIYNEDCGQNENYPDLSAEVKDKGQAKEGQWPWMVAIERRRFKTAYYQLLCSGFLIDRRHVITSASCVSDNKDPEPYRVRIGNINHNEGDKYGVSRLGVHPSYFPERFYHDMAILTLDHEVNSPNVNAICLPDEEISNINLTSRRTAVAGWGSGTPRGSGVHLNFRTGLKVISNEQCEKVIRDNSGEEYFKSSFPFFGIHRGLFICTSLEEEESPDDVCMTSGGPLMIQKGNRWFAVGITSFGSMCGNPRIPDGYTRINGIDLHWIRHNTTGSEY